jgi:hypothetical protein
MVNNDAKSIKIIKAKATTKQRKTMKALVENGGSVTMAMRTAGYSEATIKTPSKLTSSENWTDLLEEFLPNEYIMDQHKRLFNQKHITYISFDKNLEDTEIREHLESCGLYVISIRISGNTKLAFYSVPDTQAIKAALDMAHKLKGNYSADKIEQTNRFVEPITGMRVIVEK